MLQTSSPSLEHTGAQHQESEPCQASAPSLSAPSLSPFPTTNLDMQSQRGLVQNPTEIHQVHLPWSAMSMAQTAVKCMDQIMEIELSGLGRGPLESAFFTGKVYPSGTDSHTQMHTPTQTPSSKRDTHPHSDTQPHTDPLPQRETHTQTQTQIHTQTAISFSRGSSPSRD